MPQVLVVNENIHPYKEKFQERLIEIPAKGQIQMDSDEARRFLASCTGQLKDGDGQPDPRGFKRLRIEALGASVERPSAKFVSMKDGAEFETEAELKAHLKQFKEEVFTDEAVEKTLKARAPETTTRPPKRTRIN